MKIEEHSASTVPSKRISWRRICAVGLRGDARESPVSELCGEDADAVATTLSIKAPGSKSGANKGS